MQFPSISELTSQLQITGVISWLLVGLIAGSLAGWFMPGRGFGFIGNIIIGLIGAVIGGYLTHIFFPGESFGFWGSVVVAFCGACVLLFFINILRPHR